MRRTLRPSALLFSAFLMLAACSSDGDDGSATTEPPSSSSTEPEATTTEPGEIDGETLDRVAGDICSAVAAWSSDITSAYDATPTALAEADDTEAARGVVVDWMASMSTHTESLIEDLEAIDLEDAEQLEQFLDDLGDRFTTLNGIVEAHQDQAAGLTTDDPESFGAEVAALVDEFNTALADLPTVFDDLNESYPSLDLQTALAEACDLDPLGEPDDSESEATGAAEGDDVSGESDPEGSDGP